MLFLALTSSKGSEARWLCLPFCCITGSLPSFVCLPLFHPLICPEIHPSNIYWAHTLCKALWWLLLRIQRCRRHTQCFQELAICEGDTSKYNKINIDTEEIFVECALTFLFTVFKVKWFVKNMPPTSDALFSWAPGRPSWSFKEREFDPGQRQGQTLGSGWTPPTLRFQSAKQYILG